MSDGIIVGEGIWDGNVWGKIEDCLNHDLRDLWIYMIRLFNVSFTHPAFALLDHPLCGLPQSGDIFILFCHSSLRPE